MQTLYDWVLNRRFLLFSLAVLVAAVLWSAHSQQLFTVGGDDLIEHMPDLSFNGQVYRTGHFPLWNPYLYVGVDQPSLAQTAVFYPVNIFLYTLFAPITAYNVSLIGHFLLAFYFMRRYLGALSFSARAVAFGSIVYAFCGFMFNHVGVVPLADASAWVPAAFLAFERFSQTSGWKYCLWGGGCLAMQLLAGWPQLVLLSGIYLGLYATLTLRSYPRKVRLAGGFVLMFVFSACLGVVQLLPTLELKQHSNLSQLTYQYFGTNSVPPQMLIQLLFPAFFGGYSRPPLAATYWGPGDFVSVACYVGILPLLFAVAGYALWRSSRIVRFAGLASVLSLFLSFGTYTPLGWLLFRLPAYNFFRDHMINLLFTAFAIAVLSGAAISAVDRNEFSPGTRRLLSLLAPALLIGTAALLVIKSKALVRPLEPQIHTPQHWIVYFHQTVRLHNPAVVIPTIVLLISSLLFFLRLRMPQRMPIARMVLLLLVLDLGTYGWFCLPIRVPGAYTPPERSLDDDLRHKLLPGERVLSVAFDHLLLRDNSNERVPYPDILGFSSLLPYPYADLISLNTGGTTAIWPELLLNHRILSLLNTHYVIVNASELQQLPQLLTISEDVGRAAPAPPQHSGANLASLDKWHPVGNAQTVGQYNTFAGDDDVVRGVQQSGVFLRKNGLYELQFDVRSDGPHARSLGVGIGPERAQRYAFVPSFVMHSDKRRYTYVYPVVSSDENAEITFFTDSPVPITVSDISLQRVADLPLTTNPYRIAGQYGDVYLIENRDILPRAFFVRSVQPVGSYGEARGRLWSMAEPLDLRETALVESAPVQPGTSLAPGEVLGLEYKPNLVHLRTRCSGPCFLVLTDRYSPGWRASIDSWSTTIYPTDAVVRGIMVPPGDHSIEFSYYSTSYIVGFWISGLSLLMLVVVSITSWRGERSVDDMP